MESLDYELLSKKIYLYIREMILTGKYELGVKINETQLAKDFNISRTPIREALRQLVAEGFLENIPNKGITVREFSYRDIREIVQIREVLEGLAGFLACEKISEEEIKNLKIIHNLMVEASKKEDVIIYSKYNEKFHELIINNCGNNHLANLCNRLNDHSALLKISIISAKGRMNESLKEHQRILEAIKKKDSHKTRNLIQEHLNVVYKYFTEKELENLYKNKEEIRLF